MSVEVPAQKFLCVPEESSITARPRPAWKHNALHDLESVWWITVWVVYVFRDTRLEIPSTDRSRFQSLFSPTASGNRVLVTIAPRCGCQDWLSPSHNRSIWDIVWEWRISLTQSMRTFQATFTSDPTPDVCFNAYKNAISQIEAILNLDRSILDMPLQRHTL
jgi:hypothetical protein